MSRLRSFVVAAAAFGVLTAPIGAVPALVKLATIAPTGSVWDKALRDMAFEVKKSTADRVDIRVFSNNTLGADPAVVRSMRSNQIQMSLMMLSGLGLVDDSFNALGMPFFFQSDAEARAVMEKLTPEIERRINQKGFHLLAWSSGGWVQVFSKTALRTIDDVKKVKLFTSDGDTRMTTWYKQNGFNPVPLNATDIAPQLKIGMIDATPSPAYPALITSMYRDAPFMLDVKVAPLLGAIIVSKAAWDGISAEDQAKLTAAAKAFEVRTSTEIPQQETSSIEQMKLKGLTVVTVDARAAAQFRAAADSLVASMKGNMVPADVYDMAVQARAAVRGK